MTLQGKCKTNDKYWGKDSGEETFAFWRGHLLTGVMDKSQYSKFGLIHGIQVPASLYSIAFLLCWFNCHASYTQ